MGSRYTDKGLVDIVVQSNNVTRFAWAMYCECNDGKVKEEDDTIKNKNKNKIPFISSYLAHIAIYILNK